MEQVQATLSPQDKQRLENMSLLAEGRESRASFPRQTKTDDLRDWDGLPEGVDDTESTPVSRNVFDCVVNDASEFDNQYNEPLEPLLNVDVINAFARCYYSDSQGMKLTKSDSVVPKTELLLANARTAYVKLTAPHTDHYQESVDTDFNGDLIAITQATQQELPSVSTERLANGITNFTVDDSVSETTIANGRRSIPHHVIEEMNMGNNREQRRAFSIIADHILDGGPQLLMYVGGMGGTGKSHVIRAVVMLLERLGRRHELLIGAPTGIAATLIGGTTLHSLILANPGRKGEGTANERLTRIWANIRYLIVDEVSMVGAQFLAEMSSKIRIAKGNDPQARTRPFGGVSVIFTGDFCQLTPPRQTSLFSHSLVRDPSFLQSRDNDGIDSLAGAYLWRLVGTVVILTSNQRQKTDPTFARALELIRMRRCYDSLGHSEIINETPIYEYLRNRELVRVARENPESLRAFLDAPVIVGSKLLQDALNAKLVKFNADRQKEEVCLYHSLDSSHRQPIAHEPLRTQLWNLSSRKNSESLGKLPLFVGMKVMITENVSITHKAVNGAEGTVVQIVYSENKEGLRFAEVVYVQIPGSGIQLHTLPPETLPLFPTSTTIKHHIKSATLAARSFTRKQVPLVPAYSYTDYKSQGRSLSRAIVDISTARGQGVYVMLSRVKWLEGLLILRSFPASKIFESMSGELRSELNRLTILDVATEAAYQSRQNPGNCYEVLSHSPDDLIMLPDHSK
ncbi:hypothetical protein CC1G_04579 [Coprinopsis cinerea okayama7|uniref:ATP-dependent DNA helicase n=1 Tax=Coprinopsis cinerea (strain Okayama-7 / 130 / ATCC MYA-4618 / FGSC 9003) TaxID=240176 RepID=A8N501_COPC7|nr:hypothetical protein CC1G_04579 [Coprinopsis cinerea okayama7\|eukprot:XP_001829890.2 hypothetical protein CC1G_04579 [Coprinopsis cinerea okayama7\